MFPAAPPLIPAKRSSEFKVTEHMVQLEKRSRLSLESNEMEVQTTLNTALVERKLNLAISNSPLAMEKLLDFSMKANKSGELNLSSMLTRISLCTDGILWL